MKEPVPGLVELRVVWLALLGGVVVYAGTVWFILSTGSVTFGAFRPGLLTYVGPALVGCMGGATLVRRTMIRSLPGGRSPEERVDRYRSAAIVGWALMEGPGLLLVTLALLADSGSWAIAGGAASVFFFLFARPGEDELQG